MLTQAFYRWTIPDTLDHQPIYKIGIVISTASPKRLKGTVWLDHLKWSGAPDTTFASPKKGPPSWPPPPDQPWRRIWIDNVDTFPVYFPHFIASKSYGEGGIFTGCRDWFDYKLSLPSLVSNNEGPCGPCVRYRGLRRWYGLLFQPGNKVAIVKARDDERIELASKSFEWQVCESMDVAVIARGDKLQGYVGGQLVLEAEDSEYHSGGIGLIITNGSASVKEFKVEPVEDPVKSPL